MRVGQQKTLRREISSDRQKSIRLGKVRRWEGNFGTEVKDRHGISYNSS